MTYEIPKRLTDELAAIAQSQDDLNNKLNSAVKEVPQNQNQIQNYGQHYDILESQRIAAQARIERFRDMLEAVEIAMEPREPKEYSPPFNADGTGRYDGGTEECQSET